MDQEMDPQAATPAASSPPPPDKGDVATEDVAGAVAREPQQRADTDTDISAAEIQLKYEELVAAREQEQQDHLRFKADIENLKRRLQKDHHATAQYVLEALFKDLLPALDSFDRALDNQAENSEAMVQGVSLVYKQLMDVLSKHGLEQVECGVGSPFDPELHQAVKIEHLPAVASEQVVAVFQRGYKLHARLLRPAMVHVQAPEEVPAATDQHQELKE